MTLPPGWEGIDHNFLGLEEPWCHPDQAGVYVLPAPYEHTSSYVLGSDRGPSAIIEASPYANSTFVSARMVVFSKMFAHHAVGSMTPE